jgi:hypothetical protein
LVFIGDLTDRGPDSPAVLELVAELVSQGSAQCVLGNHELNLWRKARKEGNGWYFDDNQDQRKQKFLNRAIQLGEDTGLAQWAKREEKFIGDALADPDRVPDLLPGIAALDALYQDANPVRIVTSGLERVAERVFFASGRRRMVDRFPWWDEYLEDTPVIIGHYWRWPTAAARDMHSRGEPDLFKKHAVHQWLGARGNVFCVDFAVGARYKERVDGRGADFECRLAAVQWPERRLVFDDGRILDLAEWSPAELEEIV